MKYLVFDSGIFTAKLIQQGYLNFDKEVLKHGLLGTFDEVEEGEDPYEDYKNQEIKDLLSK